MKIIILCGSKNHPIFPYIQKWVDDIPSEHTAELHTELDQIIGGDLLFAISFLNLIPLDVRLKFKHTLVIHASDLPFGKGWSPHIWQILSGQNDITVSLFEAADEIDGGDIWMKKILHLEGHELFDEINEKLFNIELELMNFARDNIGKISPVAQKKDNYDKYLRRNPQDSKLNPEKTIAEQFELMRVADSKRFPCFFNFRNHRYKLILEKIEDEQD